MKFKKLVLAILVVFIGIFSVKADESVERSPEVLYGVARRMYSIIAAEAYVYNNDYGNTATTNEELEALFDKAIEKFILIDNSFFDSGKDAGTSVDGYNLRTRLIQAYNKFNDPNMRSTEWLIHIKVNIVDKYYSDGAKDYTENNPRDQINTEIINELSRYGNFSGLLSASRQIADYMASQIGKSVEMQDLKEKYKEEYDSLCDYIKQHKNVEYYITTAIALIGYVSLAAAIILSGLDFIKAITSNEDAAPKKAFQTAVKRFVAVVLIFVTHIIVQAIFGLIRPATTENYKIEMCEQFKASIYSQSSTNN